MSLTGRFWLKRWEAFGDSALFLHDFLPPDNPYQTATVSESYQARLAAATSRSRKVRYSIALETLPWRMA